MGLMTRSEFSQNTEINMPRIQTLEEFENQVFIPALRYRFAEHGNGPQRMTPYKWLGVLAIAAVATGATLAFVS